MHILCIHILQNEGHVTFEGHLWPKGSLRLGLQFDVSTINQFAMVQVLCKLLWKMCYFYLINLSNLHKSLHSTWTTGSWVVVHTSNWSPNHRLPLGHSWPSKVNRPLLQLHLKKVHFFMFLASAEAVLRPRSGFKVPSESSWVGLSDGTLWVGLGWEFTRQERKENI